MKGNIIPPSQAYTNSDSIATPKYYKALWHNCNKCRIHYMSDNPHLRAYLCDECWNSMPHFKVGNIQKRKPIKGPTHTWTEIGAILYVLGCAICIGIIGYYLWVK